MSGKKETKKTRPKKAVKAQEKKVSQKKPEVKEKKKVKEEKTEMKEEKKEVKTGKKEEKVSQKTAGKKFEPVKLSPHETLEAYKIVLHPMITEKAINLIEAENKLVFIVKKSTNKAEIRKAVEGLYGVKVESVNVVNDSKSRKKAFVRISTQFNAGEIATRLGVL